VLLLSEPDSNNAVHRNEQDKATPLGIRRHSSMVVRGYQLCRHKGWSIKLTRYRSHRHDYRCSDPSGQILKEPAAARELFYSDVQLTAAYGGRLLFQLSAYFGELQS
jgi:hypothetical protein